MSLTLTKKEKRLAFLKKAFLGTFGIFTLGFVGMKMYPLIHGPKVILSTLSDGISLQEPMIRVSGKALYTKNLIVNGENLPLAPDGTFDEKLVLNPGYNIITIAATDRFGKQRNETYSAILQQPNQAFMVRYPTTTTN